MAAVSRSLELCPAKSVNHRDMKAAVLILNQRAGSTGDGEQAAAAEDLRRALAPVGYALSVQTSAPGQLFACAESIAAEKPAAIFVGGGDGTVSTVAGAVVDTKIPLGVLPLGTLNHFARDLGLPADWRAAIPVLAAMRLAQVDVGEINGRCFINNCSLGVYPEAVRRRDALRRERGLRKWPAMFLASLAVFRRLKRLRWRGATPGREMLRTPFVLIANNGYRGHLFGDDLRPRLNEGVLWIYTTRARRHFAILRLMWQTFRHTIDTAELLDSWSTPQLTLEPERAAERVPVAIDGELVHLAPPLNFRIKPGALTVIVGEPKSAA